MSERDPFADTVAASGSEGLAATLTAERQNASPRAATEVAAVGAARFELGDEIGRGGMGVVYTAVDRQFNREVALKKLLPSHRDAASIDRFATECLVTGNLSHRGIPAVYERGDTGGAPYYAMQRVKGRTLKQALTAAETLEQRLALVPALVRAAQTIAYAHSHGVIHRDIKPSNIVVGDYGETFVLDWGIAKVRGIPTDTSTTGPSPSGGEGSTRAGAVVGTPAYMAPEQAAGRVDAIDERTDVFALGALLYHLLTGHPPYDRGTADEAVARASRCEFPSVHQAARKAPKTLRAICERAMAESPGNRFRSAADVAAALERFTSEAVAHQDTGPIGWVARAITVLTALLALFGIVSVVQAVPTFREAGWFAWVECALAALGLSLSVLEFATRGAYRLSPFILALAAATFIGGIAGATSGYDIVAHNALRNDDQLRFIMVEGTREAIGAITIACSLTVSQLLAWAIARRRTTAPT